MSGKGISSSLGDTREQMREIVSKLQPVNIRETVLMKKPTQADLKTALLKHKDKLGSFYKRKDIKKITEEQLLLGEESLSLNDAEMSAE